MVHATRDRERCALETCPERTNDRLSRKQCMHPSFCCNTAEAWSFRKSNTPTEHSFGPLLLPTCNSTAVVYFSSPASSREKVSPCCSKTNDENNKKQEGMDMKRKAILLLLRHQKAIRNDSNSCIIDRPSCRWDLLGSHLGVDVSQGHLKPRHRNIPSHDAPCSGTS